MCAGSSGNVDSNGAGDEDDDILGMGWESTEQGKWERLAAGVDSGAAENVLPADGREETAHVSQTEG